VKHSSLINVDVEECVKDDGEFVMLKTSPYVVVLSSEDNLGLFELDCLCDDVILTTRGLAALTCYKYWRLFLNI
jgi:hypothetical protein